MIVDDTNKESIEKKKREWPVGSKNFEKPPPATDRKLRSRTSKSTYIAAMKISMDLISYEDAISREDADLWRKAMDEEILSLTKNQIWTLKKLPKDRSTISCRWIFKSKLNTDGAIERYKAKLIEDLIKLKEQITLILICPLRIYKNCFGNSCQIWYRDDTIWHKNSFSQGSLEEDIYMQQPEG